MSYFKQPGLPSAHDSNLLFDASIQSLFLGPTLHPNNWDNLAASVASFDRSFATTTHRVLLPSSVSFEFSPLEIDSELKKFILHHKKRLTSHKSCHGKESGLIDALFSICHHFYDQHPLLNLNEIERQSHAFSTLSGIGSHFITPTDLPVELAFNAVGRFSDLCLDEEPSIDPDKLNIALIKCWVGWIGQRVNVSAYSFMFHIFHQLEQTPILKLVEGESSELVHFCLFGAFITSKEDPKPEQQPVKVFIAESKAHRFLLKMLLYRIMLNVIENTLNTRLSLRPGIIYTVDPGKMRVTDCIRIDKLIKCQTTQ